ncbi:hypothetical protein QBC37DRAFT_414683 [Rhypophila decipiens]|uniref:Uncharacterized protein n=1 Tax=Rhypophila decipiens TaxID=261697 RepID=A0AAN6YJ00_9PEZI|nr:hypothetical protein QBC37DRAFT_414683 [Rhypophila decipiens]
MSHAFVPFPIVPWLCHAFKVSLGKKQTHGIAMLFGITTKPGTPFDPVRDFDLNKATGTLDSKSS